MGTKNGRRRRSTNCGGLLVTIMQSYKAGEVLTDPAQQPAVELSTNLREVSRTVPGSMLIGRFQQGEGPSRGLVRAL